MEIVWLGHSCFRLRSREATIITDPYGKAAGLSLGRPTADIVTISHHHPEHDNAAGVAGNPRVIDGPGEYEIKGVVITGVRSSYKDENGKPTGKNTAYVIEMEDLVVCHLGSLGHTLTEAQVEAMSDVDVLLVPVGGGSAINAAQAAEVISQVEPKIVVPMHYRTPTSGADLDPVERFLREMSAPSLEPQPRLSVTAGSLPEETKVVLLEQRRG